MNAKKDQVSADFHLVIPCFEESDRLPPYLSELTSQFESQPYRTHILVVDDGSKKEERKKIQGIIARLKQSHEIILDPIFLDNNMGKGFAVRAGWHAGKKATWLAFADADGSIPACEVLRIFDTIYRENILTKCYFGARIRMLGHSVKRNWKRHLMGRLYATLVGIIITEAAYDSQCGFKIISQHAFHSVEYCLHENRFAFDSELIAALSDAGYKLEEMPIDWHDIPGSKVSVLKDAGRMLRSLFDIQRRRKHWTFSNRVS
jgi:dolichyl-phosphate beta-glucosyltransferase